MGCAARARTRLGQNSAGAKFRHGERNARRPTRPGRLPVPSYSPQANPTKRCQCSRLAINLNKSVDPVAGAGFGATTMMAQRRHPAVTVCDAYTSESPGLTISRPMLHSRAFMAKSRTTCFEITNIHLVMLNILSKSGLSSSILMRSLVRSTSTSSDFNLFTDSFVFQSD
jgi:hypothetical protein